MELLTQSFHMNKAVDETSYAKNSSIQSKIISVTKSVTEEAILEVLCKNFPESMGIADLGCSSGPNVLSVISNITNIIYAKCCRSGLPKPPELRIFLNDLYNNDFNDIFASLPDFYDEMKEVNGNSFGPCLIFGVPGSFYGRLFPSNSLHFVHSSSSLHWLSQVPPELDGTAINKGHIYICESSPQSVLDSYYRQFQKDFSLFLKSRSEEIVPGGRMVLTFMGRRFMDPTIEEGCYNHLDLLAQALMSIAAEGLIPEEKVDIFNTQYYAPCPEEIKLEIKKEGSFVLNRLEVFEIDWDGGAVEAPNTVSIGRRVAKLVRAVIESTLESQFGSDIMDYLFHRYEKILDNHLSKTRSKYINLVVSVTKKSQGLGN
ncbi:probable jasmonic acid carboxyl methyltransferase 2 [Juglans microcarpa x Juglans regia]|uniref:probable jasmonic acid carboxyl methyltransferase 2 n=1 Tax=Juglans microcarpa x Juglans regia TaxID=2249226 RepID=UPI001B7D9370|nr:probable jasmonic acid carboxyl methyltransferase 2 [Juglans microcarpa x Juglans regia]